MDKKVVVVAGEAPESDDETASIKTGVGVTSNTPTPCGTIISGEAPESDDDGQSWNSLSAVDAVLACPSYNDGRASKSRTGIKYNSLLHKKLHELNKAYERDLRQHVEGPACNSLEELIAAKDHLLKSELALQEVLGQLRIASDRSNGVARGLVQIIDGDYFHSLRI